MPTPTKVRRKRIWPSYLVLNNIDRAMHGEDTISVRKFKRMARECSNMCKKMHFRRRLAAGKDVFNVKTPSKQRPFVLYLQRGSGLEKSSVLKGGNSLVRIGKERINLASLLAHHDKLKKRRSAGSGNKQAAIRVRRLVHHTPKDFKLLHNDETSFKEVGSKELKEAMKMQHERMLKQLHFNELNALKTQIKLKRNSNKQVKRIRKLELDSSTVSLAAGTSSKGRKRKSSNKYGDDYARTKTELHQYIAIARIEKQIEREQKKMKEKLEKQLEKGQRKMKEEMDSFKRRLHSKGSEQSDIIIDNPEQDEEMLPKSEHEEPNSDPAYEKKLQRRKRREMKRKPNVEGTKLTNNNQTQGDGVLIRDMPNENLVISGILDSFGTDSAAVNRPVSTLSVNKDDKQYTDELYPYAKFSLKSSVLAGKDSEPKVKEEKRAAATRQLKHSQSMMTHRIIKERAKQLRIPENVQRLFKVKTEPIDPDDTYGVLTTQSSSTSPFKSSEKVSSLATVPVTVASSSGESSTQSYKHASQVLLYPKFTGACATPTSPTKSVSLSQTGCGSLPTPAPVLLKTSTGAIPVTLRTGPNGDKVLHVLLPTQPTSQVTNKPLPPVLPSVAQISSYASHDPKACQSKVSVVSANENTTLFPLKFIDTGKNGQLTSQAGQSTVATNTDISPLSTTATLSSKQGQTSTIVSQTFNSHSQSGPYITHKPVVTTQNRLGEKSKFYLVKVDGKNILIPCHPNQTGPQKAFVLNDGIASSSCPRPVSLIPNDSLLKATSIVSPISAVSAKPTATITPSLKYTSVLGSGTPTIQNKTIPLSDTGQVFKVVDIVKDKTGVSPVKPAQILTEPQNTDFDMDESAVSISRIQTKKDISTNNTTSKTHDVSEIKHSHLNVSQTTDKLDSGGTCETKANSSLGGVKDKPFSQGVSDREEKLRKLKELLREQQKAVEELRANRLKS